MEKLQSAIVVGGERMGKLLRKLHLRSRGDFFGDNEVYRELVSVVTKL